MSNVIFKIIGKPTYNDPDAEHRMIDLGTFEVNEIPRIGETVYYEDKEPGYFTVKNVCHRIEPKDALEIWMEAE
jgi:hypothetical protein